MKKFNSGLRVGVDLDNTIICYDSVFSSVAIEQGLIPSGSGLESKQEVKQYLLKAKSENEWTRLQGLVYGTYIRRATPYPDCCEILERMICDNVHVEIHSHKTQYPVIGAVIDLRQSAIAWLDSNVFIKSGKIDISFHDTKLQKIEAINDLSFDFFIDDLIDVAARIGPPTKSILFKPFLNPSPKIASLISCNSWGEIGIVIGENGVS